VVTYYGWKQEYDGLQTDQVLRVKKHVQGNVGSDVPFPY